MYLNILHLKRTHLLDISWPCFSVRRPAKPAAPFRGGRRKKKRGGNNQNNLNKDNNSKEKDDAANNKDTEDLNSKDDHEITDGVARNSNGDTDDVDKARKDEKKKDGETDDDGVDDG